MHVCSANLDGVIVLYKNLDEGGLLWTVTHSGNTLAHRAALSQGRHAYQRFSSSLAEAKAVVQRARYSGAHLDHDKTPGEGLDDAAPGEGLDDASPGEGLDDASPGEGLDGLSPDEQASQLLDACKMIMKEAKVFIDQLTKFNVDQYINTALSHEVVAMGVKHLATLSDHPIMGFQLTTETSCASWNIMDYSDYSLLPFLRKFLETKEDEIVEEMKSVWPTSGGIRLIRSLLIRQLQKIMSHPYVLNKRRNYLKDTITYLLKKHNLVMLQELSSANVAFLCDNFHLVHTQSNAPTNGDENIPDAIVAVVCPEKTSWVQFTISGDYPRKSGPKYRNALYCCINETTGFAVVHQPMTRQLKQTDENKHVMPKELQERKELSATIVHAIDVAIGQKPMTSTMFVIGDMNTSQSPGLPTEWSAEDVKGEMLQNNLVPNEHENVDRCIVVKKNDP